MNSFKRVRAFQIQLEFGSVGFWGEGKTGVPGEKPGSKGGNQQQTQPTYGVDAGIWTRATLVEGECSYHCATLAPLPSLLLPEVSYSKALEDAGLKTLFHWREELCSTLFKQIVESDG